MTSGRPKLSIIIPTRNRPELLSSALQSLLSTDPAQIEVIVVDNPTTQPAKTVFDTLAKPEWRYVRASAPLSMCDNWEFGLARATGNYVSFMTDKMTFLEGAPAYICAFLDQHPCDIATWWPEMYALPEDDLTGGFYAQAWRSSDPVSFNPQNAIASLVSLRTPTGQEGRRYYWGKICFGAYHRDVIRRAQERYGRLFFEMSPDFTSTIAALSVAETAIDLGAAMMMAYVLPGTSNGMLTTRSTAAARRFFETVPDLETLQSHLPIPELDVTTHNSLARDFETMRQRGAGSAISNPTLFEQRLIMRSLLDIEQIFWEDIEDWAAAVSALRNFAQHVDQTWLLDGLDDANVTISPIAERLNAHIVQMRNNMSDTLPSYPNIEEARLQASQDSQQGWDVSRGVRSYDLSDLDRMRAKAGPSTCLLLDDLLLRSESASFCLAHFETLITVCAEDQPNLLTLLSAEPGLSMDGLETALLLASVHPENILSLPTEMMAAQASGLIHPSDLCSTVLDTPNIDTIFLSDELCGQLRWGQTSDHLLEALRRQDKSFSDLRTAVAAYSHRFDSLPNWDQIESKYGMINTKAPHGGLLKTWAQRKLNDLSEIDMPEDLRAVLQLKHLFRNEDWETLETELERLESHLEEWHIGAYRAVILSAKQTNAEAAQLIESWEVPEKLEQFSLFWRVRLLPILGHAARDRFAFEDAAERYRTALNAAQILYGAKDWRTMTFISDLVNVLRFTNQPDAITLQAGLIAICDATFGADSEASQLHRATLAGLQT